MILLLALWCQALVATQSAAERSPITHVVARGETLSGIATRYGVSIASIRSWNLLRSDRIDSGQRLTILPDDDDPWYVVGRGDTLTEIAERVGVSLRQLRAWNAIEGDRIRVGQRLRVAEEGERDDSPPPLGAPPTPVSNRTIRHNPATRPDVASPEFEAERMTAPEIPPPPVHAPASAAVGESPPPKPDTEFTPPVTHVVVRGESLWSIAGAHSIPVATLKRINGLGSDVIKPGQSLLVRPDALRPLNGASFDPTSAEWAALTVDIPGATLLTPGNGPYYARAPSAAWQRSRTYKEESDERPRGTYERAKRLFDAFEEGVGALGRITAGLEGWHIVLDPGHGGIDPGAITRVLDGRGDPVYVVEDEYVYDIALRMYVLLRLHGARVTLTVLSPNHLVRRSQPATRTFVHERNEVYNSAAFNRRNRATDWPRGGQEGLDRRIRIARDAFERAAPERTLFLSLHADSSPNTPMVPMVLYYDGRHGTDRESRRFAETLRPAMGQGAIVKGQGLGVLRTNPASAKVLVEFRNVAFPAHAWALRFEDLRQSDAKRVVNGILAYAASR